jgi:Holliday junction resolvase RusA-like endonuclease
VKEFHVNGLPVPQGSMKVINGRVLHSQGSALAVWRSTIAWEATLAGCKPEEGAMKVTLIFVMPRPKTVKRAEPSVAPDLDKLTRAALDALTSVAYVDDGQVTELHAKKIYGNIPGLKVIVEKK